VHVDGKVTGNYSLLGITGAGVEADLGINFLLLPVPVKSPSQSPDDLELLVNWNLMWRLRPFTRWYPSKPRGPPRSMMTTLGDAARPAAIRACS
jgi:hypothetical protein